MRRMGTVVHRNCSSGERRLMRPELHPELHPELRPELHPEPLLAAAREKKRAPPGCCAQGMPRSCVPVDDGWR